MNKMILKAALLLAATLALPMSANAMLLGRDIYGGAVTARDGSGVLDSSAVFLYDDVLKVTWLRDASANGAMTWGGANNWAANLTVGAYNDWRLPTMTDTGASGCDHSNSGTDCGYNVQTKSGNLTQYQAGQTVYSEMASLWYDTLGNTPYTTTAGTYPQPGYGLTHTGDFQNLQSFEYWSGLESAPYSINAWFFNTRVGYQHNFLEKTSSLYALAVRPGDVLVSPVPEPETYALMLAGLAVVGAAAKRKARRAQ
jgi:hypothetical protein